jgi:hypothetical protein
MRVRREAVDKPAGNWTAQHFSLPSIDMAIWA